MRFFSGLQTALVGLTLLATPVLAQQPSSRTGSSRPGFDVLQYAFRVAFPATNEPETIQFVATTTARLLGDERTLQLDLAAGMQVDSVFARAARAAFTRTGDAVSVPLTGARGDTVSVSVFYHGRPTDGLIIRRDTAAGWTAFGDNFPNRARQWLAVVDHPSDKALVSWDVIAPASHRVIANGALVEETPETSRGSAVPMVRTRWQTERPIYTAVMVIGVAPFAVLELGNTACGLAELPGCVRQSVWTTPAQRAVVPGNFARAGDMVALFSRLAGPFPYEKLAHVSSSTRYGGMENAGAIFYAASLFKPGSPSESLIAHETAHQWFGDAVTEREWPHVWLSEGFATYFAALWSEHAHGDSALRRDLAAMRTQVLNAPITFTTPVINEQLDDVARVLNSNVYQKAGFVLHMLRREIGDSAFFRGIRAYYAAHRHGNAMTSDLQAEFERTSGRSLDWFFTQWLRRPGAADVRLRWRWDAPRKRLMVTAEQGDRVPPYRLLLTVDVTDAAGKVRRSRITIPAQASASVAVPGVQAQPMQVVFDADVGVLGVIAAQASSAAITPQQGIALVPLAGHWTSSVEGDATMTVDGSRWSGTTDSLSLHRAGTTLFGAASTSFVRNGLAPGAFPVAVAGSVRQFSEGTLRVRFKLVGGASDQNAGIVFGMQPGGEYHYLRYNTKDGDLALWAYADGARRVIAHGEAKRQLPLNQWHVLELTVTGNRLEAAVRSDSTLRFTHTLEAVPSGRVGVWVKRDAITAFQRFEAEPARAP